MRLVVATIVLLYGANLGKRRFSPNALAVALADLGLVNIGAAGTFMIPGKVSQAVLRARIAAQLPWDNPEMILLYGAEVLAVLAAGEGIAVPVGAKRFGTAMEKVPTAAPRLPIQAPAIGVWGVRFDAISGRIAIGFRRRVDEAGVYPGDVLVKAFGMRGTTRDWPTWLRIGKLLGRGK